jgi:hypothetical protein
MPESSLSFNNSSDFRNSLVSRTLPPYNVSGAFSAPLGPQNFEETLSDYSNVNLPNIGSTNVADEFYTLNKYGPNGGFVNTIGLQQDPIIPATNAGEYNPSETNLDIVNEFFIDSAYSKNKYGPIGGFNEMFDVTEFLLANQVHQPYFDPIFFTPSKYDPYLLYTQSNPIGSDGSLSSDSYLMRLSATKLETNFNANVAAEEQRQLFRETNTNLTSPSALAGSGLGGSRDYRITIPSSTITFLDRLRGDFSLGSPLVGPLFIDEDSNRNPSTGNQIANVLQNTAAGSFNLLSDGSSRFLQPSKRLLEQTGAGQISTLYSLLNKNLYRPSYEIGGLGNVAIAGVNSILRAVGATVSGGYYIGSDINNPEYITSPVNAVPVNSYGKLTNAIVFGPDEMGNQFEGNGMEEAKFGLNSIASENGGKPDGGFVWTSPRFKEAAGYKVKQGGDLVSQDGDFNQISSSYLFNESTNFGLKQGSILDNTQRLVNSADNLLGKRRLKHAGNAINQVSKVFHDGYKEITKGSKVMSYVDNSTGEEAGIEYCRIFTKDTPYYTFNDLQKSEGITTENRRFSYSVLDKTYNLNIAPIKGIGSTNVTSKGAKKYMISIENLAWRTSDRPGFTVDELPLCERGPNGGRIMWFPPYDVEFSDGSTANFDEIPFLGRPEPIYTYKNTTRTGKLGFKIVVDHPSIMNLLVNKQLEKLGKEKFDNVVKSFIAGCTKYDLYELAAKFNTLPLRELEMYQNLLNDPRLTPEELAQIQNEIPAENTSPENANTIGNTPEEEKNFSTRFEGIGFYFGPNTTDYNFASQHTKYVGDVTNIKALCPDEVSVQGTTNLYTKSETEGFINVIVQNNFNGINNDFINGVRNIINNKNIVDIKIEGKTQEFADSAKTYLTEKLKSEIDNKKLTITASGGLTKVTIKDYSDPNQPQNGTVFNTNQTIDSAPTAITILAVDQIPYCYPSLAVNCAIVSKITIVDDVTSTDPTNQNNVNQSSPDQVNSQAVKPQPNTDIQDKLKQAIGKKLIRRLLTECDYFELLKESDPMVLETLKDKLKFFNPAFHSMTPEGLNSRLTFLNQCVRPGQTIPVIGSDGRPKYDDALNTTFGAPPVLVIRVGDFYHTKAIPGTLSITYEAPFFDINPEGIGIQPMVVKVSLDLKFIGGHGLARPIESLQNALSFNFYANTEMYDERAEETELNYALVELVDKAIANATVNNEQTNDGGDTIGSVLTTIKSGDTESGDIDYTKIYTQLADQTRDYINVSTNQYNTIVDQVNFSMLQLVTFERNYFSGNTIINTASVVDTKLYGKPNEYEKRINKLSSKIKEDIDANNETNKNPIIRSFLDVTSLANQDNIIRDTKRKLKAYVESIEKELIRDLAQPISTIVDNEQNLIKTFNKLNVVTTKKLGNVQTLTGIDGKILSDGNVKIYNLTGDTTVFDKMITDYLTVAKKLNDYAKQKSETKVIPLPNEVFYDNEKCYEITSDSALNNLGDDEDKRFYTLLSQTFTNKDKYELLFVEFISTPEVEAISGAKDLLVKEFDRLKETYDEVYLKEKEKMKSDSEKGLFNELKTFKFEDNVNRRLKYETQPLDSNDSLSKDKKTQITQIYGQTNWDNKKDTFDGKVKLN